MSESHEQHHRLARAAAQQLESWYLAGITHVAKTPRRGKSVPAVAVSPASAAAPVPAAGREEENRNINTAASSDRAAALAILQREVAACTQCHELATTRTQTVFGVGNPQARICFFGEAPGADEDRQGEPFVGRGGQLLTKMIEACRLQRSEVYILNVLKCRPPENRNPAPDEISNCRGYWQRQLEIIRPEMICCLGKFASQTLLQTETPIGKLRGQLHEYRGSQVVCTYHPAYLLRNPPAKADAWADLRLMMRTLGVEL